MTAPESAVLPRGFTVRLDPACLRPGPRHLLGGSPMRLLTLSPAAVDLIDRAGTVRFTKPGAFDLDELNAKLIPLLNEREG